jgi:hypothetical protein
VCPALFGFESPDCWDFQQNAKFKNKNRTLEGIESSAGEIPEYWRNGNENSY